MASKLFIQTRRQSKINSSLTEDEIHAQKRICAAKKAEAIIPDLVESYDGDYEAELMWDGNGPSEMEIEKYLAETKRMKIPIDVAHDVLFDHKMDISASLNMLEANSLVPVDLVSSSDKLVIKSMENMLGKVENGRTLGLNIFPGYDMTTIYNDAFNQKLEMLFCHPAKLEIAKKAVNKQMKELDPKRDSIGRFKKGKKNRKSTSRNNTPETSNTSLSNTSRSSSFDVKTTVPSMILRMVRTPRTKGNTVPIYATVTSPESSPVPVETITVKKEAGTSNEDMELYQRMRREYEEYIREMAEKNVQSFDVSKPLPPVPVDEDIIILDSSTSNSSVNTSSHVEIVYESIKENEAMDEFVKEIELALRTLPPRVLANIVMETTRSLHLTTPPLMVAPPTIREVVVRPESSVKKEENVRNVVAARIESIKKSDRVSMKRSRCNEEEYVLQSARVALSSVTPPEAKKVCVRR